MVNAYDNFIARKSQLSTMSGFDPLWMPDYLFDFQAHLVQWAIRKGRGAVFADTGMGKTPMFLVWAENVVRHTNGRVLILTPPAVAIQTVTEAAKFGVEVKRIRGVDDRSAKIVVTNYQQLHNLDPTAFVGCICDESGILKNLTGRTRKDITRFVSKMQYRFLVSATPAPNDWTELGSSSEALGELSASDMLEEFFSEMDWDERRRIMFNGQFSRRISLGALDTMTGKWRLKGHAVDPFWRWIASWARACRKPSDLDPSFNNDRFVLPPLIQRDHVIEAIRPADGMLFTLPAISMRQELDERRRSIDARCEKVAELIDGKDSAIAWCQLNAESELLTKLIPGAVEVAGSHEDEEKEECIAAFLSGEARVLVTKPKIAGFGLNLQRCAHMVMFCTHSYEQQYQAVRRCWRFGQTRPVTFDIVWTEGEIRIKDRLHKKLLNADEMFSSIVGHMQNALRIERKDADGLFKQPEWLTCLTQ